MLPRLVLNSSAQSARLALLNCCEPPWLAPIVFLIFTTFIYLETESCSVTRAGVSGAILAHYCLCLLGSSDSCASIARIAGSRGTRHNAQLILVFLVETEFHHVGQASPKLLTSSYLHLHLPKCWDYGCEPLHPATCFLNNEINN